ncbi:uncharacterized protein EV420DRAFT_1742635 [Desarmillaria tabescens]|uniref:Uncharacterized protein n=1 Tax=Armillaria tabescens TaxID=1929756 RepID=A0AA39U3Y7_ARMTA|nr:uncharacterized protein EV420DRAFT_1742635 [Desarmillaria tabescens]KAK0470234.1 hypothetical protein EV420DRAFT_1742635 [Desarmillaria tabescens]
MGYNPVKFHSVVRRKEGKISISALGNWEDARPVGPLSFITFTYYSTADSQVTTMGIQRPSRCIERLWTMREVRWAIVVCGSLCFELAKEGRVTDTPNPGMRGVQYSKDMGGAVTRQQVVYSRYSAHHLVGRKNEPSPPFITQGSYLPQCTEMGVREHPAPPHLFTTIGTRTLVQRKVVLSVLTVISPPGVEPGVWQWDTRWAMRDGGVNIEGGELVVEKEGHVTAKAGRQVVAEP